MADHYAELDLEGGVGTWWFTDTECYRLDRKPADLYTPPYDAAEQTAVPFAF